MPEKNSIARNILRQLSDKNYLIAERIWKKNDRGSSPKAYAFIIACLKTFYGEDFQEPDLEKIITDGYNDDGVDAIYFHEDGHIDVFDIKENGEISKNDLAAFFKNIENDLLGKPSDYDQYNETLKSALKQFHKRPVHKRKLRIFVVRAFGKANKYLENESTRLEKDYRNILNVKFLDAVALLASKFETESYTDKWILNLTKSEEKYHYGARGELVVRISLKRIIKLFNDCVKNDLDLFNKNVRSFLGNAHLSEGIIETLRSDPENFHKYHNGITIAAKAIEQNSPRSYTIHSPQIINGAQTVNTVATSVSGNELPIKKLRRAHIVCKMLVANTALTEKICETSNTQAKIDLSDLRSNDNIQCELELLINGISDRRYKYLRKKPFRTSKNLITMPEFTQWIYAGLFENPADAKNKKQMLFDATGTGLYEKIYTKNHALRDLETVKALCDVGTFVRSQVKHEKNKKAKRLLKSADLHIVAALYHLGGSPTKTKFRKVKVILSKYVKKLKTRDPGITSNMIFTKSQATWKNLRKEIRRRRTSRSKT